MGMVDIKNVNYREVYNTAEIIKKGGNEFREIIQKIYNRVGQMYTDNAWYGEKYDELVNEFSKIEPNFQSILKLIVIDVPLNLQQVANNYSRAEGAGVREEDTSGNIEITIPPKSGKAPEFAFRQQMVETAMQEISALTGDAKKKLLEVGSIISGMTNIWDSEAATAYRHKFDQLRGEVDNAIKQILDQFNSLMNQQIENVQSAESSNTVE